MLVGHVDKRHGHVSIFVTYIVLGRGGCGVIECVITLHMIFSVTYYLELQNVIIIYCISHTFPTNTSWLFGHHRKLITLIGKKNTSIVKRYSNV